MAWTGATASALLCVIVALASTGVGALIPVLYAISAFASLVLLVAVVLAVTGLTAAIVRRGRGLLVVAGAVALVAAGLSGWSLAAQTPTTDTVPAAADREVRILSWNTDQQAVAQADLESIVERTDPDIVVLPEYFSQIAATSLDGLAAERDMQILGSDSSAATLLVSRSLGEYRIADETPPAWAGFVATTDGSGPDILAAHLQRPSLGDTSAWAEHISWARTECDTRPGLVAVGDFNATLANLGGPRLGACTDAAAATGHTATGTWPTALPAALGASIDHAFVGTDWVARSFDVLDGADTAGSDHRPVLVTLAPAS